MLPRNTVCKNLSNIVIPPVGGTDGGSIHRNLILGKDVL